MPDTRLRLTLRLPSETDGGAPLRRLPERIGRPLEDIVAAAMLEAAEYGALTDLARAREQIAADPGAPTEVRVAIPGDQEVGLADIDRLAHELGVDRAGLASIALTLWLARNASEDADRYWDGVQARIEALPGDWSDSL